MSGALDALRRRRSHSKVTGAAPTHEELAEFVAALASLADHSGLRPWRLIELRGEDRDRLGEALAEAEGKDREKYVAKARRAPLVLAVVVSPVESRKVPAWEQEAVASGAAHLLELLLDEAGWGVMWRTGLQARSGPVRRAHRLAPEEYLLGWLYIGGVEDRGDRGGKDKPRAPLDLSKHLTALES